MDARNCIAEALKIKPNAHFHREQYQLQVMNWMINPNGESLAQYLLIDDRKTAIIGLCGLIELGNAWESVDIFDALSTQLGDENHALSDMAALRTADLLASGHKSLLGREFEQNWTGFMDDDGQAEYRDLRKRPTTGRTVEPPT